MDEENRPLLVSHEQPAPFSPNSALELEPSDRENSNSLSNQPVRNNAAPQKLSTISGVFYPTLLSIWGILVFVRLAFCIGVAGIGHVLGMFCLGFLIAYLTGLSISAISTNGVIKGGGPYFLISRTLGVEFGGGNGVICCVSNILANAMNVFGFVEALLDDFSSKNGRVAHLLPDDQWFAFLYGSVFLCVCMAVGSVGANLYSKTSTAFFYILTFCTLFILISIIFKSPFQSDTVLFTGPSSETFLQNFSSRYASGVSFNTIFGVLYPSCTGILAGTSMSGDLKNPGRSIPKGTLWAITVAFLGYITMTLLIGSSISRDTLEHNLNVISQVSFLPALVQVAIYSTATFNLIGGILATAKIFQAMARDDIIPYIGVFGKGFGANDEPVFAVVFVWLSTQLLLFLGDLNAVTSLITTFTLLTYGIINFACFLLKISSAPNFRPTFEFFHWTSAFLGATLTVTCMFIVSPFYAALSILIMISILIGIHFMAPQKPWGEIQQALIYHQVRKYLLRLDIRKDHVKFWRPQILLLTRNSEAPPGLIMFANAMKKGALFVLGEVIVDEQFGSESLFRITSKRRLEMMKHVDDLRAKAFVEVIVAESMRAGARSLIQCIGIGAMRPNIVMLPWLDDSLSPRSIADFVGIIGDIVQLQKSLAIARGFDSFAHLPKPQFSLFGTQSTTEKYLDLYPIMLKTQLDTHQSYILLLQLGCILHMVPSWSRYRLRIIGLVEEDAHIETETVKLESVLTALRIKAKILVLSLESIGILNNFSAEKTEDRNEPGLYLLSSTLNPTMAPSLGFHSDPKYLTDQISPLFNSIPRLQQAEILNRVFRLTSHPLQTVAIFTNIHIVRNENDDSLGYWQFLDCLSRGAGSMDSFSSGLPPVIMIHGIGNATTTEL